MLKALIIIAALYVFLCVFALLFADRLAFPAPKASYKFDEEKGYLFLDASNGQKICALWLENPEAEHTILYSHGNGEDIGEIRPLLETLCRLGFNVLAYDYFGYGQSDGKMRSDKIPVCAEAAWDYLTQTRKIPEENIAVWGYSMGSSATIWLAAKKNPRAAVVMGGFASAIHAVLPVNILPWEMLNNERLIKEARCPIMLMHGRRDMVVPFRNAKRLISAANEPKKLFVIAPAGHYDMQEHEPELYYTGTRDFINTLEFPGEK